MGKKADADLTPEQPPLDDDRRWLLIETARQQMSERTNGTALTIDLQKALADDRLPCMIQSASGERDYVATTAWRDQIMVDDAPTGVRVVHHYVPKSSGYVIRRFPGRFFVSLHAFDRLWPPPLAGSAPVDQEEPLLKIDRAKAALLHLYPSKTKMPGSLKTAHRAVVTECKKRGWQPPSEDTVQRAAAQLGYRPLRNRQ
jgi:hypothetical protein